MFTAIIFLVVISVLIFVHEFGHFVFAKRAGMRVEEFGFGFPPRLFGVKKGETVYSINLIPFGGFVKILGEEGGHAGEPGSFSAKSIWTRLSVVVAGVMMNFLLAVFLLMLGNFLGLRIGLVDDNLSANAKNKQIQIIQIAENSPAQIADLRLLDEIVGFKKENSVIYVSATKEVQDFVRENAGVKSVILIKRAGQPLEKEILPRKNPPEGQGALGISLALTGVVSYPWYESVWRGVYDAVILTINTILGYWMLIKTLLIKGKLMADVSGPIGIATMTGQAARIGLNYLIQFVAMISVNLAVLNIIPFPALDGGRAVTLIIEKIKGSPINRKVENMVNTAGFALLIVLMIYVTVKDLIRIF
ncbi:MAG: Membrane-associated zinc metalloprotease [Candidatus Yanofskybacteria bacterium GW2011_GWA2_41_22]|uniref:Zinc metalloprotease n=2 Tax=Candidatus Yanofskyibacteriota TaxID=1752733 RepID=A0A0G0VLG1_9BACT|nr:MAG: Membrane-associated zinc metalloprotease [Candidatus Yanofskybacteria bacterium GW2011_GWA2_41_22]OGM99919.1 MAG: RIP metalloprotease RseP [Candidatus Yanofskybacteria bacterium RIFCSPHIGHO2_01_FULL_41_27]OGN10162.1 MAG: RIP metalloprotease RseP [Candidatus Yanofskybacteria bacterium RIFCSPHIGHO2_02_FULL_41_12]OGN20802.1 MAG: RIP metalloprotease RseP [Candidatus Yanofskybacteria bacterium RIFCSPLOWO2_01_FULL_41_33]